jgi:hypothetical protein
LDFLKRWLWLAFCFCALYFCCVVVLLILVVLRGEVRCRGRPGSRSLFLLRQEKLAKEGDPTGNSFVRFAFGIGMGLACGFAR